MIKNYKDQTFKCCLSCINSVMDLENNIECDLCNPYDDVEVGYLGICDKYEALTDVIKLHGLSSSKKK